jgi:Asp-tRNA(Asn)/Glu-tRNA(Gln) amidotransferase A subunit family amidase
VQCQIDGLSERPAKARGALFGLTVGVKDLFDTAYLPTAYGSDVYQDHCPMADVAAVAGVCAEGAVIIGKPCPPNSHTEKREKPAILRAHFVKN